MRCLLFCVVRFKSHDYFTDAFNVDPLYLKHDQQDKTLDFRVLIPCLLLCFNWEQR